MQVPLATKLVLLAMLASHHSGSVNAIQFLRGGEDENVHVDHTKGAKEEILSPEDETYWERLILEADGSMITPTPAPLASPTVAPSAPNVPSPSPSSFPSLADPTSMPSTSDPTSEPSPSPSVAPVTDPTSVPSDSPTSSPTGSPTVEPSEAPSASPSVAAGPTSSPSRCMIGVSIDCIDERGTSCDTAFPAFTRCQAAPTSMAMLYTGGDCSRSLNLQPSSVFSCINGDEVPPTEGSVFIEAKATDGNEVYFSGIVEAGSAYNMTNGGNDLGEVTTVTIFSDSSRSTVLQTVEFATACQFTTFLFDRYGANQLVQFINDSQGIVDDSPQAAFINFTISNTGEVDAELTTLVTNIEMTNPSSEFEENLSDEVFGETLAPGENFTVPFVFQVMLAGRREYTVTANSAANFDISLCFDSEFISFNAGYRNSPNSPAP